MFLLVSVRHVGAHPDGHQHGVSIQISINFVKTFLRISRIRNIPLTWILARVFAYLPPFISQILDFIFRMVLIYILIYFECRGTENQQYHCMPSNNLSSIVNENFERRKIKITPYPICRSRSREHGWNIYDFALLVVQVISVHAC